MKRILEVIVVNKEEAIIAEQAGADRLELLTNFELGGLTPTIKVIADVVKSVKIPVNVMVRPNTNLVYDQNDFNKILTDIEEIKKTNANGIVFGSLDEFGHINKHQLDLVIKAKGTMQLAFHRAFDKVEKPKKEILTLLERDVEILLTSGTKNSAIEGVDILAKLKKISKNSNLHILIGSGVGLNNIKELISKTKAHQYHVGSSVREDNSIHGKIDPIKIKEIREILDTYN